MKANLGQEVDQAIKDLHEVAEALAGYAEELHGFRAADGDDDGRVQNLVAAVKAVKDAMPAPAGD